MIKIRYDFTTPFAKEMYKDRPPQFSTEGACAVDLRLCGDPIHLGRDEAPVLAPTGIRLALPVGYVGLLTPRSGLSISGLHISNSPGIIDADYRGEICVVCTNIRPLRIHLSPGQRIAQLLIVPAPAYTWVEGINDRTIRGSCGFGSTGG